MMNEIAVTVWEDGSGGFGVRIPVAAKRQFSEHWTKVHVEVDGELCTYPLRETFWTTCPELRGRAIGRWIKKHGLTDWPKGKPPKLRLIPLGGNRFRLAKPA